jgi:hypothetical protein
MEKVFEDFKYWGYFLDMRKDFIKLTGIRLLILCLCDCKIVGNNTDNSTKFVEYDVAQSLSIMEQTFNWLNGFTDTHNIPEEVNRRKSVEIGYAFTGHLK